MRCEERKLHGANAIQTPGILAITPEAELSGSVVWKPVRTNTTAVGFLLQEGSHAGVEFVALNYSQVLRGLIIDIGRSCNAVTGQTRLTELNAVRQCDQPRHLNLITTLAAVEEQRHTQQQHRVPSPVVP